MLLSKPFVDIVTCIFNLFSLPVFFSLVLDSELAMDNFLGLYLKKAKCAPHVTAHQRHSEPTLFSLPCSRHLTTLAKRYIYTCLNSADAQMSFPMYTLVFSDRRRRLSEEKLKALVTNSFLMNILCN